MSAAPESPSASQRLDDVLSEGLGLKVHVLDVNVNGTSVADPQQRLEVAEKALAELRDEPMSGEREGEASDEESATQRLTPISDSPSQPAESKVAPYVGSKRSSSTQAVKCDSTPGPGSKRQKVDVVSPPSAFSVMAPITRDDGEPTTTPGNGMTLIIDARPSGLSEYLVPTDKLRLLVRQNFGQSMTVAECMYNVVFLYDIHKKLSAGRHIITRFIKEHLLDELLVAGPDWVFAGTLHSIPEDR